MESCPPSRGIRKEILALDLLHYCVKVAGTLRRSVGNTTNFIRLDLMAVQALAGTMHCGRSLQPAVARTIGDAASSAAVADSGRDAGAPDKIEVLAQMTGVPVTWLRYGLPVRRDTVPPTAADSRGGRYEHVDKASVTADELRLLTQLRVMPASRRELVKELVQELALESEMWSR